MTFRITSPPNLVVGDDQGLVINGQQRCGHERHVLHLAQGARNLDQVTRIVRAIDQDHDAGRKVGQGVLQCKAHDDAGDSKAGEERRHIKPQLEQRHQQTHDHNERTGHRLHRSFEEAGCLDLGGIQELPDQAPSKPGEQSERQQDQKEDQDPEHKARRMCGEPRLRALGQAPEETTEHGRFQKSGRDLASRFEKQLPVFRRVHVERFHHLDGCFQTHHKAIEVGSFQLEPCPELSVVLVRPDTIPQAIHAGALQLDPPGEQHATGLQMGLNELPVPRRWNVQQIHHLNLTDQQTQCLVEPGVQARQPPVDLGGFVGRGFLAACGLLRHPVFRAGCWLSG